jgi:hypothetical protein
LRSPGLVFLLHVFVIASTFSIYNIQAICILACLNFSYPWIMPKKGGGGSGSTKAATKAQKKAKVAAKQERTEKKKVTGKGKGKSAAADEDDDLEAVLEKVCCRSFCDCAESGQLRAEVVDAARLGGSAQGYRGASRGAAESSSKRNTRAVSKWELSLVYRRRVLQRGQEGGM